VLIQLLISCWLCHHYQRNLFFSFSSFGWMKCGDLSAAAELSLNLNAMLNPWHGQLVVVVLGYTLLLICCLASFDGPLSL
jgi:hypothetical protein